MTTPPLNLRQYFAKLLHAEMEHNQNIWLVTGDLGFGLWDQIRQDFPERFLNTGAAEQGMMGIAVGLAQAGKIPFVYSITPFLLYRPFETIRNYLHYEKIPVKLIGSGRDQDYETEGYSHWANEDREVMKIFSNIHAYWPNSYQELDSLMKETLSVPLPYYLNLKRG